MQASERSASNDNAWQFQRIASAECELPSTSSKFLPSHNNATTSWMRTAQFAADGTTLIAHSDDHKLHTFVLPPELLDVEQQPHKLKPYASVASPTCMLSFAIYPHYTLTDTNTTWVLTGERDVPIRLRNALDYTFSSHSYPWMHPTTEALHGPNSLLFVNGGAQFAVGTRGHIAILDVERPGDPPLRTHKFKTPALSPDRSIVMGLAVSASDMLAVGTTNRNISLWSKSGHGEGSDKPELSFPLTPPRGVVDDCPGTGVTSLAWSPCERYLLVAERQSDCIQVFDVRNGGQRLSWLSKRNAISTQRFEFSIVPATAGIEVWGGGMDGKMRLWTNAGAIGGEHLPQIETALDKRPLGGTSWHPQGALLASTSGGRLHNPKSPVVDVNDDLVKAADSEPFDTLNLWLAT